MSHPFFDAVAFPWEHPLAARFHKTLCQAINRPYDIELRCKKCSGSIQLKMSATADEIWKDALEKLTTASGLKQLCEDLLNDDSVKSIHLSVHEMLNLQPLRNGSARSRTSQLPTRDTPSKRNTDASSTDGMYGCYVLVLSARLNQVDLVRADAILTHLQSITEDSSLTLIRIEEGSVRLVLHGAQKGYEKLKSIPRIQLAELLGFPVVEVSWADSLENSTSNLRFEVAISFAGDNKRDKVRAIAEILRDSIGSDKVFFDEWYEAEIAGNDAVDYFQNVYGKQTQLVVVCVCARYNEKAWTQDEWRAIRAFERGLRDVKTGNLKRMRLLPLRFGDGEVDGLFSTAIVPDVRDRTPEAIAKFILERLRLSKGGLQNLGQPSIAETDADLLDDAARPYEPKESREWYDDSRKRLQRLAQEILDESEVTRKFVLQCNGFASTLNGELLAQKIFDADETMTILRSCLNQTRLKSKLPEDSRKELHASLFRLIDFIAPACFSVDDLRVMEAHVNRKQGDFAKVTSNSKCIAVTKVAGMKGVRADLNTYPAWEGFNLRVLPESREICTHLPKPPEPGRRHSRVENPIDALVTVLADAVHAVQKNTEFVQAKLRRLAEFDKIYFVIVFDTQPNENYLRTLHETFPELMLLVAQPSHCPSDPTRMNEITLEQDIADLRAEFGPQQSGSSPA